MKQRIVLPNGQTAWIILDRSNSQPSHTTDNNFREHHTSTNRRYYYTSQQAHYRSPQSSREYSQSSYIEVPSPNPSFNTPPIDLGNTGYSSQPNEQSVPCIKQEGQSISNKAAFGSKSPNYDDGNMEPYDQEIEKRTHFSDVRSKIRRVLQRCESEFGLEVARNKYWRRFAYYTMRQAKSSSFPSDKDISKFLQDSISLCDEDEKFLPILIDVIKKCIIYVQGGPKEIVQSSPKEIVKCSPKEIVHSGPKENLTSNRESEPDRATKANQEIERLKKEAELERLKKEAELERMTQVNQEIEKLKKERDEKIAIIDQMKKREVTFAENDSNKNNNIRNKFDRNNDRNNYDKNNSNSNHYDKNYGGHNNDRQRPYGNLIYNRNNHGNNKNNSRWSNSKSAWNDNNNDSGWRSDRGNYRNTRNDSGRGNDRYHNKESGWGNSNEKTYNPGWRVSRNDAERGNDRNNNKDSGWAKYTTNNHRWNTNWKDISTKNSNEKKSPRDNEKNTDERKRKNSESNESVSDTDERKRKNSESDESVSEDFASVRSSLISELSLVADRNGEIRNKKLLLHLVPDSDLFVIDNLHDIFIDYIDYIAITTGKKKTKKQKTTAKNKVATRSSTRLKQKSKK